MSEDTPEIPQRDLRRFLKWLQITMAPHQSWTTVDMLEWFQDENNQRKLHAAVHGVSMATGNVTARRFEGRLFCGAGPFTLQKVRVLHERLDYGLAQLSGLQQEGLMGTEFDEYRAVTEEQALLDVVADVQVALLGTRTVEGASELTTIIPILWQPEAE